MGQVEAGADRLQAIAEFLLFENFGSGRIATTRIRARIELQGCSTLSTEDHCEHGVEASERGGEAVLRDRVGLARA